LPPLLGGSSSTSIVLPTMRPTLLNSATFMFARRMSEMRWLAIRLLSWVRRGLRSSPRLARSARNRSTMFVSRIRDVLVSGGAFFSSAAL
jgi:hypothetical protein